MYMIAVCDPDVKYAKTLGLSVHKILDSMKISHCIEYHRTSETIYELLKKYPEKYNFIFLETNVSPSGGIKFAKTLRNIGFKGKLAFISTDASLVFEGYNVEACQYFLKPVEETQLRYLFFRLSLKALQRPSNYLLLNDKAKYYKIRYSEILYVETDGRKVRLHTLDEEILYPCKLSEMEELLPSSLFFRCHQSYLVQFEAVSKIVQSKIILKNGEEIPISRPYKKQIHTLFINACPLPE